MNALKILFVVIMGINFLIAQEKYPSRNTKEWNELTVAQRWQAVNIPETHLRKMSTNDLIEHCINFDFMWDIFNYQDYETGLNVVISNHNGLRELLDRKDAGRLILDFYRKIDPNKITTIKELIERGEFEGKIFFLELYLSHSNILRQMRGKETDLIKAILMSHNICLDINSKTGKDYYSGYSILTKALVIEKALVQYKGLKESEAKIQNLDISSLSNKKYKKIIEEASRLTQ